MNVESAGSKPPRDVRMLGFAHRWTVAQTLDWIDSQTQPLSAECVALQDAHRRVLASDVHSPVDVPGFARAMMDGYAVRAADVAGASSYHPIQLTIIGEAFPGRAFPGSLEPGQAVCIMTGAPLPEGADAVLPAEYAQAEQGRLRAAGEVPPAKHVGRRGEDISAGAAVLAAGRQLRPQDLGLLSSIGRKSLQVVRRPRVRLVITGDELLPPGSAPEGCRIADANGPMLSALVQRDGAVVDYPGLVPDSAEAILEAFHQPADVVVVSGGSSVGLEDHAPQLLARHGELAIHGVAIRPSSPTGMGRCQGRLVFLLPGNPVSCLCAYDFFAGRAIRALGGADRQWPYRRSVARLVRKLSSVVGRVDYARVRRKDEGVEPLAISGASLLSSTTRADGFVVAPQDSEGFPAGAEVEVWWYD